MVDEADCKDKKVFVRVDFNTPLDKNTGEISDRTRIAEPIDTIRYLSDQGARIVLVSHLGRPKDKSERKLYSLRKCEAILKELMPERKVSYLSNIFDPAQIDKIKSGEIKISENIRFHVEETSKDEKERMAFAKKIASNFDLFVNDAFGASHRDHASVTELPQLLKPYIGYLMKRELEALGSLLSNPKRPFVAVVGGAKVSTKLQVLKKLLRNVDTILIGGAMAYTFLYSRAVSVGSSMLEKGYLSDAFQIIDQSAFYEKNFILPIDHVVSDRISHDAKTRVVKQNIPKGLLGGDIGPKTVSLFTKYIKSAETIFWNGPMGVFEFPKFFKGTQEIARAIAQSKAKSLVGGGDSIYALRLAKMEDKITHVSTGGGATLEFLEKGNLPGLTAIKNAWEISK